jgi:hypothetical protein
MMNKVRWIDFCWTDAGRPVVLFIDILPQWRVRRFDTLSFLPKQKVIIKKIGDESQAFSSRLVASVEHSITIRRPRRSLTVPSDDPNGAFQQRSNSDIERD